MLLAFVLLSTSCSRVPDTLDMGHLPCRASISIDRFLKPFPTMMLEGTEPSTSMLSYSKRVCRGDNGGDESRAKEKDRSS
jgi:hypothetical protein